MHRRPFLQVLRERFHVFTLILVSLCLQSLSWAQDSPVPADGQPSQPVETSVRELRQEVRELQAAVAEMRAETSQYRDEARQLRRELTAARMSPDNAQPNSYETAPTPSGVVHANERGISSAGEQNVQPLASQTHAVESESTESKPTSNEERTVKLEEEYQLLSGKVDEHYQSK